MSTPPARSDGAASGAPTDRVPAGAEPRPGDAPDTEPTPDDGAEGGAARAPRRRRESGDDTMLSAPVPADGAEGAVEDRVARMEREVRRLTARIDALEARRPIELVSGSTEPVVTRPLVLWVLALALLAAVWLAVGPDR